MKMNDFTVGVWVLLKSYTASEKFEHNYFFSLYNFLHCR